MQRTNVLRTLGAALLAGGSILATSAFAQPAQGGNYGPGNGMGYGMMGGNGYGWFGGGFWLPLLLVIVVAGLVAWFVAQKKK
jgi:hypothetical protein